MVRVYLSHHFLDIHNVYPLPEHNLGKDGIEEIHAFLIHLQLQIVVIPILRRRSCHTLLLARHFRRASHIIHKILRFMAFTLVQALHHRLPPTLARGLERLGVLHRALGLDRLGQGRSFCRGHPGIIGLGRWWTDKRNCCHLHFHILGKFLLPVGANSAGGEGGTVSNARCGVGGCSGALGMRRSDGEIHEVVSWGGGGSLGSVHFGGYFLDFGLEIGPKGQG
mmetsp:Transcript_11552/g.21340  ORF Transcript_11552/g.21340 Transcript_11552/m.21340 type:complete len:223 (-) Transcript_11552:748-1416(-)